MDYSKKSKEDLIEEIEFLKKRKNIFLEKDYKNLFDNSPNLLYIHKKDGKFIDVNNNVLKKYGYTKKEIIGKTPDFLAGPNNDLEEVENIMKKVWGGENQVFNFSAKKKDGTTFYKEVRSKKILLFGEYVIISSGKDITKEKENEDKLKLSEKRFKILSSATNETVLIHEEGIIKDINKSGTKLFGYKKDELIGKNVSFLTTNKTKGKIKKYTFIYDEFFYEAEGLKKDGSVFIAEVLSKAIKNKNKLIKVVTIRDITKQKTVEEHLKENQKRYKTLFTKNLAGLFISENGIITECNNSFAKIFGFNSRVELIGKKSLDLYFSDKERNNYLKDLKLKQQLSNYKLRHKKKDGSEVWISTNVSIIYNENGDRLEGSLVEITDEIKKEQLIREQLRAVIAEKSNKILQKEIIERKKIEIKLIENQQYTKNIINSSIDIICASDKEGRIIEFNHAAEQAFGYTTEQVLLKGIKLVYASKDDYLKVSKELSGKGFFSGEIKNIRKNGEIFTTFLSASTLHNNNNKVIGTMGVSRDITEIKKAEKQLVESEEKYRDLFENATDLIQSLDMDGNIIYVNNAWKNTLEYSENEIINQNIFTYIDKDSFFHCNEKFKEISNSKEGIKTSVSFILKTKNNKKINVEGSVSLKYKNGKPFSTRAILRNVTGELWEKTKQYVYNNIAKIVTEKTDPEEIFEDIRIELSKIMNTNYFIISYLLADNMLSFPYYYDGKNRKIDKKNRKKGNGINEYFLEKEKSKLLNRKELDTIVTEGKYTILGKKCISFIGVPLKIKNKTIGVLSIQSYTNDNEFNDKDVDILDFISGALALIVQRKQDEAEKLLSKEKLLKSLKEKEILLKEVHHRVKNNLQVISSILNLQSSYVKDEKTLYILKESQNRIKAMSFIHESLYKTNDFSKINFSEYIAGLSKNLVHSYGIYDDLIKLKLSLDNIYLNLDLSIPCGLIINELVSNALKYAFYKKTKGEIDITLFEKNNDIHLIIGDNGVGLPKEVNFRDTESLGLQLVITLAEQIDATISLDNTNGAKYILVFKKE